MLISLSAVSEDPKSFDWYRYNGKRSAMIAPDIDRKIEPDELFGIRPFAKRKGFYLVFPDKMSQKFRIDTARNIQLVSKSKPAKYAKATASSSRKGVGGRKAKTETPFDHPRWHPKTQPSAASEKTQGIDCKDYQWRVYKQQRPFKAKVNKNRDPIELQHGDIIGMRFMKVSLGGMLLFPDGTKKQLPTAIYDSVVEQTSLLAKNRWITRTIDPEQVKAANVSNRRKALDEARQAKQEIREAKQARERKAAEARRKANEKKEADNKRVAEMIARKDADEDARKQKRAQDIKDSTVDVGDYIRDVILEGRLDEEVLDVLDMDDLESIEIDLDDLDDLNVAVKDTGKEFSFEDDPSDDILSGLDSILESARQEDEDELSSELDNEEALADQEDEEAEADSEETEEDDDAEADAEDADAEEEDSKETEEDEEATDDEDFSEFESDDEDAETDEENSEEDADATEDEDEDFSEFEDDETDDVDETDETDESEGADESDGEEDEDDLDSITAALDEAASEDEQEESEEDDAEDFDDEFAEEDDMESFEDEDEDYEDADLEDDGDLADDEEEVEDESDTESTDESEDEDTSDPDDVLDDETDPEDEEVAAAEKELDAMGELGGGDALDEEDEEEPQLPEEADIISFNNDEDNRKFLVFDVADMQSNDKVKLIKLYDMDNEPDEVHVVRVQTDRLKQFTDNIEVVSRMNAKTFGNYVTMVEEYPKSKEKLV